MQLVGHFYIAVNKDEDIPDLIEFLEKNPKIISVDISSNHIDETGGELLATTKLKHLNLANNHLDRKAMKALAQNKTLESLDVSGYIYNSNPNYFDDEACDAFSYNTTLKTLIVSKENYDKNNLRTSLGVIDNKNPINRANLAREKYNCQIVPSLASISIFKINKFIEKEKLSIKKINVTLNEDSKQQLEEPKNLTVIWK
ncbi:MAG: hypothetical protein H0U57_11245 [Tatlockia sp.]|nr:hypothetical protein [Tatlockia sp.]